MNKRVFANLLKSSAISIAIMGLTVPAALATVAPEPPTAVPEPGPFGLLLLGVLALLVVGRFTRNR